MRTGSPPQPVDLPHRTQPLDASGLSLNFVICGVDEEHFSIHCLATTSVTWTLTSSLRANELILLLISFPEVHLYFPSFVIPTGLSIPRYFRHSVTMCQGKQHEFLQALPKCEHHMHLEGRSHQKHLVVICCSELEQWRPQSRRRCQNRSSPLHRNGWW